MSKSVNSGERFKTCRLCLENDKFMVSLFCEYAKQKNVHSKIKKYLQIDISPNDSLPKHICYTCLTNLELVETFVTKARNSDMSLKAESESNSDDSLFSQPSMQTPPGIAIKTFTADKDNKSTKRSKSSSQEHPLKKNCTEVLYNKNVTESQTAVSKIKNSEAITKHQIGYNQDSSKVLVDKNISERKAFLVDYFRKKCTSVKNIA